MKTIKTLLKDFLSWRISTSKEKSLSPQCGETQNTINPQNTKNYETANQENPGDNNVVDTTDPGSVENPETNSESEPGSESGLNPQSPIPTAQDPWANHMQAFHASSPIPNTQSLKAAYEQGLIDGRNLVIEETYFPKGDDGIPHFRGNPSLADPMGDIFSMAREA
ncbi:MAG: hypothetical protein J1F67_11210 [Muribaculaceae bacterium]|nr:hypothetical protein [Muribaculaceae bacterium]